MPSFPNFRPTSWLVRSLALVVLVALVAVPAHAQGAGPSVDATMASVKNIAVVFLRGAMAVGLVIGLVKVARNFLNGSPEAITSFMWLMGGTVVFFLWGHFFRSSLAGISVAQAAVGNIGNSNLNPGISAGAYDMAQKVINVMISTVVPLLLFATVGMTVIRGFISNGSVQFELGPIFRGIFMFAALLSYNTLVPQVGNLVGAIANQIKDRAGTSSTSAYAVLHQLRDASDKEKNLGGKADVATAQNAGTGTTDGPGLLAGFASSIGDKLAAVADTFSPQKIVLGLATDFMTSVIQEVMEFIQSFFLAFLYVAGPISLTFSLLPGFGGLAKSWLQSLISVHMWSIAFQVIAGLFAHYQAYEAAMSTSSTADVIANMTGIAQTKFMVACLVFIIMYVLVPKMTSMIVGSSGADGFVGAAMRVGTAIAKGAATGGAGALSVAGAGATAANSLGAGASLGSRAVGFAHGAGSSIKSAMGMGAGSNLSQIGQMLGGGPPAMPGAGNNSASGSSVRTSAAPANMTSAPAATPAPAPSYAAQGFAQQASAAGGTAAAPPVSAPVVTPNPVAAQGAAAAQTTYTGGSQGGFDGFTPVRPAIAAAPAAALPGQLPSLNSGQSRDGSDA